MATSAWTPGYGQARMHMFLQYGIYACMNSHDCDDAPSATHAACCELLEPNTYLCLLNGVVHVCNAADHRFEQAERGLSCPYMTGRVNAREIKCCHTSQPVFTAFYGSEQTEIFVSNEESTLGEKDKRFYKSQLRSRSAVGLGGRAPAGDSARSRCDLRNVAHVQNQVDIRDEEIHQAHIRAQNERDFAEIYGGGGGGGGRYAGDSNVSTRPVPHSFLQSIVESVQTVLTSNGRGYATGPPAPPPLTPFEEDWHKWTYEPEEHVHFFAAAHLLPRVERGSAHWDEPGGMGACYSPKIPYASPTMKNFCAVYNTVPQDYFWEWHARHAPLAHCGTASVAIVHRRVDSAAWRVDTHMRKYARALRKVVPVREKRRAPTLVSSSAGLSAPDPAQAARAYYRFKHPGYFYSGVHRDLMWMTLSGSSYLDAHIFPVIALAPAKRTDAAVANAHDRFMTLAHVARFVQMYAELKRARRQLECDAGNGGLSARDHGVSIIARIASVLDNQLEKLLTSLDASASVATTTTTTTSTTGGARRRHAATRFDSPAALSEAAQLTLGQLASVVGTSTESGFGIDLRKMLQRPTLLQRCYLLMYCMRHGDSLALETTLLACRTEFAQLYKDLTCAVDRLPLVRQRLSADRASLPPPARLHPVSTWRQVQRDLITWTVTPPPSPQTRPLQAARAGTAPNLKPFRPLKRRRLLDDADTRYQSVSATAVAVPSNAS